MTKKIGIVGWKTGENSYGVTLPYMYYFGMYGETVVLKYDEPVRFDLDLVVIPGGPDVDPKRYNRKPHLATGKPCIFREYFDTAILPQYIENNVPIFGICRGHQTIGVHFNATLQQHMYHETNKVDKRGENVHNILYRNQGAYNYTKEGCNSIHHQVVSQFQFPEELKVIARYIEDKTNKINTKGMIEAMVHRVLPVASVQFHPEELFTNGLSNKLVECLLNNPEDINNLFEEIEFDEHIHSKNKVQKSLAQRSKR
jgi:gamma-glutamyl-gamma-aminobutyrate hydrolase PuuD